MNQLQLDLDRVIELSGGVAPAGHVVERLPQVGEAAASLTLNQAYGDLNRLARHL